MTAPAASDRDPDPAPADPHRRWRLVLGADAETACGGLASALDAGMDRALAALYGGAGGGPGHDDPATATRRPKGGLQNSAPSVSRWLGDIRSYFPASVVHLLQQDALERLNLRALLADPAVLETVQPDVRLVADLVNLSGALPEKTKATARLVVRKVTDDLENRLATSLAQAVNGALDRASRNHRPRHAEIDWPRTLRANLKHYQPAFRTVIPERLVGYGRKSRRTLKDIVLCIDQSGSMAASVVYASVFGAVLASLKAVSTRLVVFDTSVVDLSEKLADPVDVLFGVQLGGGTDICRALTYCQGLVRHPEDTVLVLISDLLEGGNSENLLKRVASLTGSGVTMVTLLALSDEGRPAYDPEHARAFGALGSPAFACTPDQFPGLMAAALQRQGLAAWAGQQGIRVMGGADRNEPMA